MRDSPGDALGPHARVTVIEPPRGLGLVDPSELWAYRELLRTLVVRQVRVRYKQTLLGTTWAVIQPVTQAVVFSLIFGEMVGMPSEGAPYAAFVYAGLLAWSYFAQATLGATSALVSHAPLVSKVYFPRLLIPLAAVCASLLDLAVASAVMVGLLVYFGIAPTMDLLFVPVVVLGLMLAATGVGTALGALNVAFRDLQHAMTFVMQIWFYATPVVYPMSAVPERLRWVPSLNPMTGLVEAFRSALLGRPLDGPALAASFAVACVLFAAGTLAFHRLERQFADVI